MSFNPIHAFLLFNFSNTGVRCLMIEETSCGGKTANICFCSEQYCLASNHLEPLFSYTRKVATPRLIQLEQFLVMTSEIKDVL